MPTAITARAAIGVLVTLALGVTLTASLVMSAAPMTSMPGMYAGSGAPVMVAVDEVGAAGTAAAALVADAAPDVDPTIVTMQSSIHDRLTPVAWTVLMLSLIGAAVIAADIYLRHRRHVSVAFELVWIASGLYLGPFAIPIYRRRGRARVSSRTAPIGLFTGYPAVRWLLGRNQTVAVA